MAEKKTEAGQVEKPAEEVVEALEINEAEQADGFAAGFAEARGEEPPAPREPAAGTEAVDKPKEGDAAQAGAEAGKPAEEAGKPAEDAAAAAAAADPWKDVPPAMRAAVESLTAAVGKVESLAKTAVGRVGAVQAALDAQKKALVAGKDAPTQAQIQAAAATDERWKKLKTEYPDWAGPMEEQLAGLRAEIATKGTSAAVDVNAIRADLARDLAPAIAAAERRAREFAQVDIKHDGWEDLVNTDGFKAWLPKQPDDVRRLAASSKGRDAITLIDKYKGHVATQATSTQTQGKNQKRLEAALPATEGKAAVQQRAAAETEEQAMLAGFNSVRNPT